MSLLTLQLREVGLKSTPNTFNVVAMKSNSVSMDFVPTYGINCGLPLRHVLKNARALQMLSLTTMIANVSAREVVVNLVTRLPNTHSTSVREKRVVGVKNLTLSPTISSDLLPTVLDCLLIIFLTSQDKIS